MWRDNGWERGRGRGHPALKLSQRGHLGVSVATVPRAEFPPHTARFRARWGGAAGRAVLTWAGSAHLGGAGLRCCRSCPDWAGRAQPGLIRARSCSPAWADGAGLPSPSSPPWTQSRGLFAASPGVWGSWRGLDSPLPGHGGAQGGAGGSLEPGERDRDRSLLSPALSWRVSLGKQNDPPRIPSFPRLQVKKKIGKLRHGLGQDGAGKGNAAQSGGAAFPNGWFLGMSPFHPCKQLCQARRGPGVSIFLLCCTGVTPVLAGTGTGGFGTGVGAPGQQLPSPGCFHLPSHTLNPMAHEGAILAPLWCWISPGSVHWLFPE